MLGESHATDAKFGIVQTRLHAEAGGVNGHSYRRFWYE